MPRRCQVSRACFGSSGTTAAGRFQPNRIFRSRTHRRTAGSAPAPVRLRARRAPSHRSRSARPLAPRVLSPDRRVTRRQTVRLRKLCARIYALVDVATDTRSKALVLSSSIPHACDWLQVIPSRSLGLHFQDCEFRVCLLYWLVLPIFNH